LHLIFYFDDNANTYTLLKNVLKAGPSNRSNACATGISDLFKLKWHCRGHPNADVVELRSFHPTAKSSMPMSKRASSSTTDQASKRRRTQFQPVASTNSGPRPSNTRYVRLTCTNNNRLNQQRTHSKTTTHTLPIDDVHPDDAVDEWVNVDDNGDQNNLPAAAPSVNPLPKKKTTKKKKKNTSSVHILAFVL